jgi:hypothetical protein
LVTYKISSKEPGRRATPGHDGINHKADLVIVASLVEQMAAAASSLNSQANDLVHAVALFKLDDGDSPRRALPSH